MNGEFSLGVKSCSRLRWVDFGYIEIQNVHDPNWGVFLRRIAGVRNRRDVLKAVIQGSRGIPETGPVPPQAVPVAEARGQIRVGHLPPVKRPSVSAYTGEFWLGSFAPPDRDARTICFRPAWRKAGRLPPNGHEAVVPGAELAAAEKVISRFGQRAWPRGHTSLRPEFCRVLWDLSKDFSTARRRMEAKGNPVKCVTLLVDGPPTPILGGREGAVYNCPAWYPRGGPDLGGPIRFAFSARASHGLTNVRPGIWRSPGTAAAQGPRCSISYGDARVVEAAPYDPANATIRQGRLKPCQCRAGLNLSPNCIARVRHGIGTARQCA